MDKTISVRVSDDLHKKMKEIARKENRTIIGQARQWLSERIALYEAAADSE